MHGFGNSGTAALLEGVPYLRAYSTFSNRFFHTLHLQRRQFIINTLDAFRLRRTTSVDVVRTVIVYNHCFVFFPLQLRARCRLLSMAICTRTCCTYNGAHVGLRQESTSYQRQVEISVVKTNKSMLLASSFTRPPMRWRSKS